MGMVEGLGVSGEVMLKVVTPGLIVAVMLEYLGLMDAGVEDRVAFKLVLVPHMVELVVLEQILLLSWHVLLIQVYMVVEAVAVAMVALQLLPRQGVEVPEVYFGELDVLLLLILVAVVELVVQVQVMVEMVLEES